MRVNVIGPARPLDLPGHRVHRQVGERQRTFVVAGLRAEGTATQHRPDPGEQLVQRKRLGQVVVGTRVESVDPVVDGVPRGEHQDRQVVAGRSQGLGRLDAVEPRHHDVDDQGVGGQPVDPGERLHAVVGDRHLVPVELERAAQRVADGAVVVDDKNAHTAQAATRI